MDFHILNTGDTPTFETHRGDRLCTSIVDVTACSESLLGKMEGWRVDRNITTSDHNAITFSLRLESPLTALKPSTTRRYNTKKARWSEFDALFKASLISENLTSDRINGVGSPEELETIVNTYTKIIQDACEKAIQPVGTWNGNPTPPWWNKDLQNLKTEVLRFKNRIKNACQARRKAVIYEYLDKKQQYTEKANDAQTQNWKQFCTTQDKESMWDGVYRVIRKSSKRHEDMLLRDANGKTLSPEKSAELLACSFYPDDTVTTDTPYHTMIRNVTARNQADDLSEDDPPFTPPELDSVLAALNPKKAPGPDGLTSDICERAIRCDGELFMALANKCLSLEHFPMQWKMAHVVILRKPGKDDYTQPKSYRPIGLLNILGKIIEKMMVGRIQWHVLPTLNKKQYGFIPQRGTEDALYDLVSHIRSEIKQKKIVLVISLDIEGAFDNAWWPALKYQLGKKHCPKNLYQMVCSYLTNRYIKVNYARAVHERNTTKGCVQGSIGGPTFWNIILDSLLNKLTGEGVYSQAFADDVVLVFSDQQMSTMEEMVNDTLERVVRWGRRNKLNFAAHKTSAMIVTKKLKYDPPCIYMSQNRLNIVEEIKLLGLIIDNRLTFKSHIAALSKKTADIYKQLACAAKVTWGLNTEIVRTIYVAVIEPLVLYAASVWYPAVELQMIRNQLDALQRGYAQKICKAYRTVSLTSALVLSGLLPLDLRVREAAMLFLTKKKNLTDYIPPFKTIEQGVSCLSTEHPSTQYIPKHTQIETLDDSTISSHHIVGPHIYTDGSKIEGKVGAAITLWKDGKEVQSITLKLDPACTVFQAELYALYRAVQLARQSSEPVINIMSDSRSALQLLENPKSKHRLVMEIKKDIKAIEHQNRWVRLFWIRAHVGTVGNERADELAKSAAHSNNAPNYAEIPLSYVKRRLREESVLKWQDRYTTSSTGSITKIFFPDVGKAYSTIRKIKMTGALCQAFTGHGGFAEYLHRFKLRNSPGCECDPNIAETITHIILDCPRFLQHRYETECRVDDSLTTNNLKHILNNTEQQCKYLLEYIQMIVKIANRRNSGMEEVTQATQAAAALNLMAPTLNIPSRAARLPVTELLKTGQVGEPGIRIRVVPLFMDTGSETLGVCFCNAETGGRVIISPGLAVLLNGSTAKNTMRRRDFNELPERTVTRTKCRLVRAKNKTIALLEWNQTETPFSQANSLLREIGGTSTDTPRRISVDAMAVGYVKGSADNYLGCIEASKRHEVVVYENRGEDLSFLKPGKPSTGTANLTRDQEPAETLTGSERLQRKREAENKPSTSGVQNARGTLKSTIDTLKNAIRSRTGKKDGINMATQTEKVEKAVKTFYTKPKPTPKHTDQEARTKADMGQVNPPILRAASEPRDHIINAFLEFQSILKAEQEVYRKTCEDIMQAYLRKSTGILQVRLKEAEAAIYNNDTSQYILGEERGTHMAAYSSAGTFVESEETSTEDDPPRFKTPSGHPIVVVARCTRIMLNNRILERAMTIAGTENEILALWDTPKIRWVNGVPGSGKTTWVVNKFVPKSDMVITTTREAVKDLREKLEPRVGATAKHCVRTLVSVLVNGPRDSGDKKCTRIIVDEALMNHFGAIVMATRLIGVSEAIILGDRNQLPFIDRNNLFELSYCHPDKVTAVDQELLCTYRSPMDVAFALSEVYSGIYSSRPRMRSLKLQGFKGAQIPKDIEDTLYLTHTQEEKALLIAQGFGTGKGSRVNTIHEAQGATFGTVVIVRTKERKSHLNDSVSHAVVAISRHTKKCVYYTDDTSDAIAHFISKAEKASPGTIRDYNIKMAIKAKDERTLERLLDVNLYRS